MKRRIRLTESELGRMIVRSVRSVLREGQNDFEPAKYNGKWSVYDKGSRTFSDIGVGRRKAAKKAREMNDYCRQKDQKNESRIARMVRESVNSVLREGGHLYNKDEDGNVWTNSKETYRGVPGSTFVYHGDWSDPEILYNGHEINYYDFEEGRLWSLYNEFMRYGDEDEKAEFSSDMGVDAVADDEDVFEKWIEWRGGVDFVQDELDDFVSTM